MKQKRIIACILTIFLFITMSGCVYSNNKEWDDLSVQEQQEVKEELDDVKEEIKEEFSEDTSDFALEVVGKVEKAIINNE